MLIMHGHEDIEIAREAIKASLLRTDGQTDGRVASWLPERNEDQYQRSPSVLILSDRCACRKWCVCRETRVVYQGEEG
jgi:hypothetical protein